MTTSPRQRISLIAAIVLTLAISGLSFHSKAGTSASDLRQAALQSCPTVEDEIVDMELLASGLRDSKAIGMFDKIRLKSSIDDLLKRMEAFHDGKRTYSLAELQEQYDVLLMKIASHLQHKDVIMHGQLCNAWDLIWLDLEDPGRFKEKFK
jgi:hypothetical protein